MIIATQLLMRVGTELEIHQDGYILTLEVVHIRENPDEQTETARTFLIDA